MFFIGLKKKKKKKKESLGYHVLLKFIAPMSSSFDNYLEHLHLPKQILVKV
jgi:hypothetical protein